jgi:hypothetical protein
VLQLDGGASAYSGNPTAGQPRHPHANAGSGHGYSSGKSSDAARSSSDASGKPDYGTGSGHYSELGPGLDFAEHDAG